jgi:hypothetical protein
VKDIGTTRIGVAAKVFAVMMLAMLASTSVAHAQDPPPPIDLNIDESIGVGDGQAALEGALLDVSEVVGTDDQVALLPAEILTITEQILTVDTPTLIPPVAFTINEVVTTTDSGGEVSASILVNAGADQTAGVGEVVTLAAQVITLNPEFATVQIDWADGGSDSVAPTTTGAIAASHVYAAVGQYEVTVAVVGPFGDLGEDTTIITVVNAPPTVDIGGPYAGNVGEAIILSAVGSDPAGETITYAWDLNNDGLYDDATDQATIYPATAEGSFSIAVEVTDAVGQVANDTALVIIQGALGVIGSAGPPEISISPSGSLTVFEGETVYVETLASGDPVLAVADLSYFLDGVVLTSAGAGYSFPQFTHVLGVPIPQIPAGETSLSLSIHATITDSLGQTATSETLSIRVLPAEEEPGKEDLGNLDAGKILGSAIIGLILKFESDAIWVGADFSAVRVHVDSNTQVSAALGAEAFATGNRVVVIADGPVADGNATALKITPIPSKATREHQRVLVVKADDKDEKADVVDEDGEDLGRIDAKGVDTEAGDQVVVIVKDRGRGGNDVKVISTTKDVSERLDEIAQKKFDEGDLTDSSDVDKLRDEQRARDKERVEKIAEQADAGDEDGPDDAIKDRIKEATERADEKIKVEEEKEEADPLQAVRKETAENAATDEHTIAECASDLLGRKISRKADVTPEEAERVDAECIGDDGRPADDTPPPEVLECAERVLGRTLDGPISEEEKALVAGECAGLGGGGGDEDRGEPPPDVLACIEDVLGRPLDRNLSEEEFAKIDAACGAPEDGGAGRGDGPGEGPGGAPPAEVVECIERVLGRAFTGDATEAERARFEQECSGTGGPGGDPGQEPPPNVLECIEQVLGRPLDGSVTTEERAKFDEVCGAPTGDQPPGDQPPAGDAPPPEVAACAERVLGRAPDGPVTEAEKAKITEECFGLGQPPAGDAPPPSDALVCAEEAVGHKIDGPLSDDEKRAIGESCRRPEDNVGQPPEPGDDGANKQVAFCDANPGDAHCENFVPPSNGGGGGLPPIDGDGGGGLPPISDELLKLCEENPNDEKCGNQPPPPSGEDGRQPPVEDELTKLCAENPRDEKCGNQAPPPPTDELTKLCAENPRDPKCGGGDPPPNDAGTKQPPPDDGETKQPPPDDGGGDPPPSDGGTKQPSPDDAETKQPPPDDGGTQTK